MMYADAEILKWLGSLWGEIITWPLNSSHGTCTSPYPKFTRSNLMHLSKQAPLFFCGFLDQKATRRSARAKTSPMRCNDFSWDTLAYDDPR